MLLNVSEATLLMPRIDTVAPGGLVDITGWRKQVTAQHVWRSLTGTKPFVGVTLGTFIDRALPSWERERLTDEERRLIKRYDDVREQMTKEGESY